MMAAAMLRAAAEKTPTVAKTKALMKTGGGTIAAKMRARCMTATFGVGYPTSRLPLCVQPWALPRLQQQEAGRSC
jgi:hypothetical protein